MIWVNISKWAQIKTYEEKELSPQNLDRQDELNNASRYLETKLGLG